MMFASSFFTHAMLISQSIAYSNSQIPYPIINRYTLGIFRNMIHQILRHIGTINNEWIVSNTLFSNLTGRIENEDIPISINDRMLYVINTQANNYFIDTDTGAHFILSAMQNIFSLICSQSLVCYMQFSGCATNFVRTYISHDIINDF